MKSAQEMRFTSSLVKFMMHPEFIAAYRAGRPCPISTHVSPTARCSLNCAYCSVATRERHDEIPLPTIKDYIGRLAARGLRAVILTGGGEPTMYPQINELLDYLRECDLKVGLITNGVTTDRVRDGSIFDWVRVSVNFFDGWQDKLGVPAGLRDGCTVGLSVVCGAEPRCYGVGADRMDEACALADRLGATYIRLLPDCFLSPRLFRAVHAEIAAFVKLSGDPRFFHQQKERRAPNCGVCHQSFFRPYLSELDGGTVFPCDSVVLNSDDHRFTERYAVCAPEQVLDWLDGRIKATFDPRVDCGNCVFTESVETLGFIKGGVPHVDFP